MARKTEPLRPPLPITAAELTDLLKAAGAPVSLDAPDLCNQVVERINNVISVLAKWRQPPLGRDAFMRAQSAVDELRRVLPEVHRWASLPIDDLEIQGQPEAGDIIRKIYGDYRGKVERLSDALFDIGPHHPNKLEDQWATRACLLFSCYQVIANPKAGISRAGPAVRFVQLMLDRIGEGRHSADAIEKVLHRRRAATTNSS